jgi:hypothetical protein
MNPRTQAGEPRVPFVQLCIQRPNLAEVSPLKDGQLASVISKLKLSFGKIRANRRQLLTFS